MLDCGAKVETWSPYYSPYLVTSFIHQIATKLALIS
jgi:hypothetical protein